MPLYKAHIQATAPYRTKFREADVIFTARDTEEAEDIADFHCQVISPGNPPTVNAVWRIGP